jgi:hypothetical protein
MLAGAAADGIRVVSVDGNLNPSKSDVRVGRAA